MSEHELQASVIQWARLSSAAYPELRLLFAVPNGGHRHAVIAARLKAEGVVPGVPDLVLPVARGGFHGLWIEMKTPEGRVSKPQADFHSLLSLAGHHVVVCRSLNGAIDIIKTYLRKGAT